MASKLPTRPLRGMKDVFPPDSHVFNHVAATFRAVVPRHGFNEVFTPIVEDELTFTRNLGAESDVVSKEMYQFQDRSGNNIVLRPENTASMARAFLHQRLFNQPGDHKLAYIGPMFRYERPQKGRYRQFHQAGVEWFGGTASSPLVAELECLNVAVAFLTSAGIPKHDLQFRVNTLGDESGREEYTNALRAFLSDNSQHLAKSTQEKFSRPNANVLRILDSKEEADRHVLAAAPKLSKYLSATSMASFELLCSEFQSSHPDCVLNHDEHLVRGLDYYNGPIFEVFHVDDKGSHDALLAGGRYDGLTGRMGGPSVPAVGWAAGIERIVNRIAEPPHATAEVGVLPVRWKQQDSATYQRACMRAIQIAQALRSEGVSSCVVEAKNTAKGVGRCSDLGMGGIIFVGEEELAHELLNVKYLETSEQTRQPLEVVVANIRSHRHRSRQ